MDLTLFDAEKFLKLLYELVVEQEGYEVEIHSIKKIENERGKEREEHFI